MAFQIDGWPKGGAPGTRRGCPSCAGGLIRAAAILQPRGRVELVDSGGCGRIYAMLTSGCVDDLANFKGWALMFPRAGNLAHFVVSIDRLYRHETLTNIAAGGIETACGLHFDGPAIVSRPGTFGRCKKCAFQSSLRASQPHHHDRNHSSDRYRPFRAKKESVLSSRHT